MAGRARPPLQANTCQPGAEAGPQSAGFVDKQHFEAALLLLVRSGRIRITTAPVDQAEVLICSDLHRFLDDGELQRRADQPATEDDVEHGQLAVPSL
jgi:hypothetical protein